MSKHEDILKKLMFGISIKPPKTDKSVTDKNQDRHRMRLLPDHVTFECQAEEEEEDEGVQLLGGNQLTMEPEKLKNLPEHRAAMIEEQVNEVRRLNSIYVWGSEVPRPMLQFADVTPPEQLLKNIQEFSITEPSPIQMQTIPIMLQKRDLLATAPTGSGKTLAFSLPIIMEVVELKKKKEYAKGGKLIAVVLEPTRELAIQTYRQFLKFGQGLPVKAAQLDDPDVGSADVVVGTPRKLLELIEEHNWDLQHLRWLIIDEGDRLFDKFGKNKDAAFRTQLESVFKKCTSSLTKRAFFSATFMSEVERWCKTNMPEVLMICVGEKNSANANVVQELKFVGNEQGKGVTLRHLLSTKYDPPVLLFVQNKDRADQLFNLIKDFGVSAPCAVVTSDKSQKERDETIEAFRSGKLHVLICTELMGRGLDLPAVNLVINYDLPPTIVSYIHRIGRTGRAGRSGHALTYFTYNDFEYIKPIAGLIHQSGHPVPEYILKKLADPTKSERDMYKIQRKNIYYSRRHQGMKKGQQGPNKGKGTHDRVQGGKVEKKHKKERKSKDGESGGDSEWQIVGPSTSERVESSEKPTAKVAATVNGNAKPKKKLNKEQNGESEETTKKRIIKRVKNNTEVTVTGEKPKKKKKKTQKMIEL